MTSFQTKPHYHTLDGLRGVAALVVIVYHVFECFDWTPLPHGYLSVDFFFVLSGFVIGYAYDDRWSQGLTTPRFFMRRLIRLHPMVIAGAVLGAVCFFIQGSVTWGGQKVATSMVMIALLLNVFMVPLPVGARPDVRGNGELFPLNGPNWSLFFEDLGTIFYALLLRRLSTRALAVVTCMLGAALTAISLHDGFLGVGWSMANGGLWTGMVRMLFPYSMGMLLARMFRPAAVRHAFWKCAALIVAVACLPLALPAMPAWCNGAYDAACVLFLFPAVVWLGASEAHCSTLTRRVSCMLGDLSYPLYAVHYPLMYLFYAHIGFDGNLVPIEVLNRVWPVAVCLPLASIALAWATMKCYDLPVRRRLSHLALRHRRQADNTSR